MSRRDISQEEIYGTEVLAELISRVTDSVSQMLITIRWAAEFMSRLLTVIVAVPMGSSIEEADLLQQVLPSGEGTTKDHLKGDTLTLLRQRTS